ncbi:apoptosis-inducing factor 1 [Xylona heveae TC161]|uniref:Apoptosis-inducing factor 1 n=1 Tax=Xylona heveae (strain CBS 132557 / TC161) TaxID=1328760 RepID=A0A161TQN8_XYLHT|nr:apoptosis-inducing factor 1 [Xylona heveae TC161]KZF24686.1 apoptosis-inducing factor 1 [Xylona heveae TC161]
MTGGKTIVIIGGSFAGIGTAHGILKAAPGSRVVLINPSDKFYFNIAAPRLLVHPDALDIDAVLLPIAEKFAKYDKGAFELVVGLATSIDEHAKAVQVSLSDSQTTRTISYDYLVIASGSTTAGTVSEVPIPFKETGTNDLKERIQKAQRMIAKAQSILIAGAGPVGVETAGELADGDGKGGGKRKISLVSRTPHVLPMLKEGAGIAAEKALSKAGVELLLSTSVESARFNKSSNKWIITLADGHTREVDLYISAAGTLPNSSFVPKQYLSSDGWVKVDETMHAVTDSHTPSTSIYALGDITIHPARLSFKAAGQVPIVVANLKADIDGLAGKKKEYRPSSTIMMAVPIGKNGGVGQLGSFLMWSFFVWFMKGRDYFVSKAPSFVSG